MEKSTINIDTSGAVSIIDSLLQRAVEVRASDIHIDPRQSDLFVRFRIDGELEEVATLPKLSHEEVIARLKILSGTRTDLHLEPQDGRWQTEICGRNFNIRISFMPTYHGENAVMRILPVKIMSDISFAKLGFTPDHARLINTALDKPNGLILITGPTGSGKTTTIHVFLSLKAREPLSIITLEDPIEYEIPGVRQVHVRHNHGVTFATGLRAALRQDPNVIMVGEIRDTETARVAIHTALTGHLVLSTLHTNSAIDSIPRLFDMGVDHYLLSSTLRLIIAQRLVRNICHNCFQNGCEVCRFSGYSGRSAIAEVCEINEVMSSLIEQRAAQKDLETCAREYGFRPLIEDGMEKVEWGVTTNEELRRVLAE